MIRAGAAVLAILFLLAGCVSPGQEIAAESIPTILDLDETLDYVSSGLAALGHVTTISKEFPGRTGDEAPAKLGARAWIESELAGARIEPERHEYAVEFREAMFSGVNVVGKIAGRTDQWVVLTAHYDSVCHVSGVMPPAGVCDSPGAWDDGAGVATLLELAKSAATREWNRGLAFVFLDDEEEGLVGSRAFVLDVVDRGMEVAANLNFDSPGINWPCEDPGLGPLPLAIQYGIPRGVQTQLVDAALHSVEAGGYPEDAVLVYENETVSNPPVGPLRGRLGGGSSDHVNFARAGIPFLFFFSDTAHRDPVPTPWTYTFHSAIDTVEQMETRCGGKEKLAGGLQTTLDIAIGTLIAFDGMAH